MDEVVNPKDADFNWVKARRECSLFAEFVVLRNMVEKSVKERKCDFSQESRVEFEFRRDGKYEFSAIRSAYRPDAVTFSITEKEPYILVQDSKKTFRLTVTLNDDGECRFKIDGEGEYLRWQVARKALEDLFMFEG